MDNRDHLIQSLLDLSYKGVTLEILNPSEYIETKVTKFVSFVPYVGATYNLISAGVYYYISDKPGIAARRFKEGINVGIDDFKALAGVMHVPYRFNNEYKNALDAAKFELATYYANGKVTKDVDKLVNSLRISQIV
ncbi:GTP-binding protein [Gigaspora margarita]|uniref:GTP-binding protein n=1 Tax=Gigaspora margarita TaxID=4874 RepID=A0A8H4AJR7_GIGMA|nr:GTP-binding protein [Gigaspora margarita]